MFNPGFSNNWIKQPRHIPLQKEIHIDNFTAWVLAINKIIELKEYKMSPEDEERENALEELISAAKNYHKITEGHTQQDVFAVNEATGRLCAAAVRVSRAAEELAKSFK
jgi:hypothetical protein